MRDGGRGVARSFRTLWILSLIWMSSAAVWHTYEWDPSTPFITLGFLLSWFIYSLVLGIYASLSAWWQATAENNPWQVLTFRQILGWLLGHTIYVLLVMGFYMGVLMGLLFALDATMHRYTSIVGPQTVFVANATKYLMLVTFGIVAIGQTMFVGTPMARSFIRIVDKWLGLGKER